MKHPISVESLYVNYEKMAVLWDVSFKIPSGVIVGILGPNGAGKSTLLKAMLGLVEPLSGSVEFWGSSLEEMRHKIAYVPQRESIDWNFPITVQEVVMMGRYGRLGLFGRLKTADIEAVSSALERVGIKALAKRQISELSGGEQQRLFIARSLVQDADLLLLDEPFVGIDLATEKMIISLLKKEKAKGKTICIVHHDLTTVQEYFDWTLLLNHRLIGCGPTSETFQQHQLDQLFGKGQMLFNEALSLSVRKTHGLD